ncbi:hypothetical protein B296_00037491 [Ensete ventricosum]|uniref:Uncharacterized protein n=1 Tax=Ensete ventricosum TaxID=4639 RepID=A0A426ZIR6_ENSVE|nr:hypothetical protein B296_00037491 [Ensete ventricosum]
MRKSRTPKGRGRGRRRRRASQGAGATAAVVTEMEGDFSAGDLGFQLGHVTLPPFQGFCSSSTGSPFPFEKLLEAEGDGDDAPLVSAEEVCSPSKYLSTIFPCHQQVAEVQLDDCDCDQIVEDKSIQIGPQKRRSYVSKSAVALRFRVTPPPCIRNPYIKTVASEVQDIFDDRRFKSTDGCLYAVKQIIRQLRHDMESPIGYRYADHPLSSKSAINSRFRPLTIDFGHWRLISTIGGRLREKEEEGEEEKRENKEIPTLPRFPMRSVAHGSSSVGFLLRSRRRGEKGEGNSPRRNEGTPHLPARGEGRMR